MIRAICYANSKTRPLFSPARRHARRQVANGTGQFVFAHELLIQVASNYQSPATFHVRSSSAVRPLCMGNCHDRAISQTEVELQAVGPSYRSPVHAFLQLASKPAGKLAGSSPSSVMRNLGVQPRCLGPLIETKALPVTFTLSNRNQQKT